MVFAGMTSHFHWCSGQNQVWGLLSDTKGYLRGRGSLQGPSKEAGSQEGLSPPRGHPRGLGFPDSKGLG